MDSQPAGWIECNEPRWRLTFSYPITDSLGRQVTVERQDLGSSMRRVHVMADDRDEIYFEVVRQAGISPSEFYASLRERLPELYDDVEFAPLAVDGATAVGSFRWADQERAVRFFEFDDATYRIIFRPVGAVNLDILATVKFD